MSENISFDVYEVTDSDTPVKLKLTIGYAQKGNTDVLINGRLQEKHAGNFETELGSNNELNKKKLQVTTTVVDIQPETNNTSVTIELEGGKEDYKHTLEKTVPTHGSSAFYNSTFIFRQIKE